MGSVYLADDLPARRRRVIKELRLAGPELLAAFRDEFALLSTLSHPSVTRVHDFGSCFVRGEPLHYYTADQVDGVTLAEASRARREVPMGAVLDALEGLGALHARGICHGDVTPENLLVRSDGRGVLIDLGCARPFGAVSGLLSGTPEYMAPELRAAGRVDGRADLFALGRTLERVHSLAGCSPTPQVAKWIARLVAPAPGDRPAKVDDVLEGLGRAPRRGLSALERSPRLLGREAQIERFSSWLAAFRSGALGPRLLALRGPSGSGTSRLLRELVSHAELELPVLRSSAEDTQPVSWLLATASTLAGPLERSWCTRRWNAGQHGFCSSCTTRIGWMRARRSCWRRSRACWGRARARR
jgi:serine/threonine protein kinase